MTRRGAPGPVRSSVLVFVFLGLAVLETASAGSDPLQAIHNALDAGDVPAAAAAAEVFIAASPGDPRLADAQWLLGLARERAGARGAAWDQYLLFLSNFPAHPARDEVAGRAEALVRRITQRALPPPSRWRVTSLADRPAPPSEDVGVVVALGGPDLGGTVARTVTRAAVDGERLWIWRPLGTSDEAFDPFDAATVDRLEREFRTAATWPIEGFVIDGALYLTEGARSPSAARAYEEIAATMLSDTEAGRERLAWTWAGVRARASARALQRWVTAVASVNPRAGWLVRVSTSAIVRPERALRDLGEDLAELRLAAPTAVWAIDGPVESGPQVATHIGAWGSRPSMAVWSQAGDIVAVP
jgi:hypothetical protein